ncbi:efflux RND transporter permease subunit [Cognatishimia activa]|uniref:efflux RND transporter permease subunit n=1 Tax=Cognatishimia activa TaxID=1715691 RepID=UPI0022329881|nr:efflux RND transporter permease subunit [Cognatishimia activa]UZD90315.1 efflux RND transporter permease subunit [Cognatishimia activa]
MLRYFAHHPNAANLILLAGLLIGLITVSSIERETFPEFSPSIVTVDVTYPGASAVDVDEQICVELDGALSGTSDLHSLQCQSVEGRATATLEMSESGEIGQFFNDVSSGTASISTFPTEVEPPVVAISGRTEVIALLAVSGLHTEDGLLRYAEELADRIGQLSQVAGASVSGVSQSDIIVSFSQEELRRYGVSAQDVADILESRSLQAPLGSLSTSNRDIALRLDETRRTIPQLEDLIILRNASGGLVRLGDFAKIELRATNPESKSLIDGNQAAIISITKAKANDAIDAFAQVTELLEIERSLYPAPFAIEVTNDMTATVADRIDLVVKNTIQGLALVIVVMLMFFSLREAIWISAALPFSFLVGLFLMSQVGVTINMISLIALLMAVGLIMDDSIVIADNIAKWRREVGPQEAAYRGMREVFPGVLSSFLTTACVFGPLMFLSGTFGAILKVIPIVLLITLSVSLIEAFLILPRHLSHTGSGKPQEERLVPRLLEAFKRRFVLPAVVALVRLRYFTVGTVVAILIVCVGLIANGTVKIIGFPATEADTIEVRVALTTGSQLDRTETVVETLITALERVDAELTPATEGGLPLVLRHLVRFSENSDVKDNGPHTATVSVDLLEAARRNVSAETVLAKWKEYAGLITDVSQINFTQSESGPGGNDLEVELFGRDAENLAKAAGVLLSLLQSRDDVISAYQDFYGGTPEISVSLNEYAYSLGVTQQHVVSQLRTAFSGTETDNFKTGATTREVRVELSSEIRSMRELEQFSISLPGGQQVALSSIASLKPGLTFAQITRKDGAMVARIIGDIDNSTQTATGIGDVVTDELGPIMAVDYPDVSIGIGGSAEETGTAMMSIATSLLLGLVGVYIILAFQFHSYAMPIFVMMSIPFALIGTILGHVALGYDLSMPSLIGFASLAGVVVNNAILFLTFFEGSVEDGNYESAVVSAVDHRFRAVILSSSTTFVGLLPIIYESSPQAQTLVPLVVAVAFGLLASTFLVIFVFPALIAIFFDFGSLDRWLETRDRTASETLKDDASHPNSKLGRAST